MSRLAMMESDMKKNVIKVCSYRKIDYVIVQVLKGIIMGTVCFVAIMLLWLGFLWDDLNIFFADAHFEEFIRKVIFGYCIFILVYLVICAVVAAKHYKKCRKQSHLYLKYLKRLNHSYASDSDERKEN